MDNIEKSKITPKKIILIIALMTTSIISGEMLNQAIKVDDYLDHVDKYISETNHITDTSIILSNGKNETDLKKGFQIVLNDYIENKKDNQSLISFIEEEEIEFKGMYANSLLAQVAIEHATNESDLNKGEEAINKALNIIMEQLIQDIVIGMQSVYYNEKIWLRSMDKANEVISGYHKSHKEALENFKNIKQKLSEKKIEA